MKSLEIKKWLLENTFYCPVLMARLTPEQCQRNRNKKDIGLNRKNNTRLRHCQNCKLWEEWQIGIYNHK